MTDKGLKKWKGVALSPENERKLKVEPPAPPPKLKEIDEVQKENVKPEPPMNNEAYTEPTVCVFISLYVSRR